jgi:hypothetical protein
MSPTLLFKTHFSDSQDDPIFIVNQLANCSLLPTMVELIAALSLSISSREKAVPSIYKFFISVMTLFIVNILRKVREMYWITYKLCLFIHIHMNICAHMKVCIKQFIIIIYKKNLLIHYRYV